MDSILNDEEEDMLMNEDIDSTKKLSSKKKGSGFNFFNDEADVAEDSDESDDDEVIRGGEELVLPKDIQEARKRVADRHEANREFQNMSADEIAREIENRHKQEVKNKKKYEKFNMNEFTSSRTGNLALLPSISDPHVFKVKCKPGMELQLVSSVMRKAIDSKNKGGLLRIKSAFCTGAKGVIYIEAINEAFAKESMTGLRGLYFGTCSQVYIQEMTSVLSVSITKKPLEVGQWVRVRKGGYKGDLARVVNVFDGGEKAMIELVPRVDYNNVTGEKRGSKIPGIPLNKIRPPQRLFDVEEAKSSKNADLCRRGFHPRDPTSKQFDIFNNEYYRNGLYYKEVNVITFLNSDNIKPTLDELRLFRPKKSSSNTVYDDGENVDDEEMDEDEDNLINNRSSFVKDLAEQIKSLGEAEEKDNTTVPFVAGDLVQIASGESRGLKGKVIRINDSTRIATILPYDHIITSEMTVEVDILTKYITPGQHVKVITGRYLGQTGRIVSVTTLEGTNVAAILTDGVNTEIQCNVDHLQMTAEVAIGPGNLMGYEIYDLVVLNENECAVIITVGAENLRIINHTGIVKDVYPQELQSKRNAQSARATAFDSNQNTISVGDVVNVTSGAHAKQSGTIKHIMKGNIFLHSNSYLKNSGMFVVKGKNCVIAGNNLKGNQPALAGSYSRVVTAAMASSGTMKSNTPNNSNNNGNQRSTNSSNSGHSGVGRGGKDSSIGKTVRITKGAYKSMLAQVIDVTPTHFSVELLAKLKKVVIERSKTVFVGDSNGSFDPDARNNSSKSLVNATNVTDTPFLTQATPVHIGSETPRYGGIGGETPNYYGAETPDANRFFDAKSGEVANIWKVNQHDTSNISSGNTNQNNSQSDWPSTGGSNNVSNTLTSNTPSSIFGSKQSDMSSYNNGYSPAGSMYSLSDGRTPLQDNSSISNTSRISTSNNQHTFQDWIENMVVVIQKGEHAGKMGVIQQRVDSMGMLQVSLRRSDGTVERNAFSLHYDNLRPALPSNKRESVVILSGQDKGSMGIIK
eukprot:gene11691-15654_t